MLKIRKISSVFLVLLILIGGIFITPISVSAVNYNPSSAVAYAKQYWNNYNPNYPNYNSSGGDCANFVSQCLYAGGIPQDGTWYNGSSAWISCTAQINYFKSKGYTVIDYAKASDIKVGNPVYYYNGNSMAHTAICVGYSSNGTPLVAAHNSNFWEAEWTLGGASWWGGSDRRVTILMNENNDDVIQPTISDPIVANANGREFTIQCNLNDNIGITRVWLNIYGPNGTQNGYGLTASNGLFSHTIQTSDYAGAGVYTVHIYAFDAQNNETACAINDIKAYDDTIQPTISDPIVTNANSREFTIQCNLNDNVGVTRVWLNIYGPNGTQNGYGLTASNGLFSHTIQTSDYAGAGVYTVHIYAFDAQNNETACAINDIKAYDDTIQPTISDPIVTNANSREFTIQCNLNDNVGVTRVWLNIYGPNGTQNGYGLTASNGLFSHTIQTSDYAGAGVYTVHIYAFDAENNETAYAINNIQAYDIIEANNIHINPTSILLNKAESYILKATIIPDDTTDKTVTWQSSDKSIVTVSNGKVKAIKEGTAIITAKTVNGKTATCKVTVVEPVVEASSISLNKTALSLNVGSTANLTATITPTNATDKTVTWKSSNTNVATVSNGKVTAKSVGTATITAKTSNGKTATCKITVPEPVIEVESISLNKTALSINIGNTANLTATITPKNATDKTVNWKSSNTSIATVSNGKVTAKSVGTATITAKTSNGKTATCKITVIEEITSISINKSSLIVGVGETFKFSCQTDKGTSAKVTYTSSKTSVAIVDSNGNMKAKSMGTAIITATTDNGKIAKCRVTVKKAPTSISINRKNSIMGLGETFYLEGSLDNDEASRVLTFSSNKPEVATVTDGGIVTAKSIGTAIVSITTYNGQKATCRVTVKNAPTSLQFNKTSITLKQGETFYLESQFNTGEYARTVIYNSSNKTVATIGGSGVIMAKSKGTVKITGKTYNGKTQTCTVTVK